MIDVGKLLPEPEVRGSGLVIGRDGRVKVDNLEALPPELRRAVEQHNARMDDNGSDSGD